MKALWSALVALSLFAGPAAVPLCAAEGWVPLGPPGGDVRQIVVHPRNPRVLWAATYFYGIYKSVDGGATWSPARQGLSGSIRTLAVAPSDPDILYAVSDSVNAQVFRSSDGGRTWALMLDCTQSPFPCCGCVPLAAADEIAVHPRAPQTVFAATRRGLLKSVDGGRQWRRSGPAASTVVFDPRDPNVLYAGAWNGIFRSRNGGATWSQVSQGVFSSDTFQHLLIDPRNPRRMWAGGAEGVYRSTDGGVHWRRSGSSPTYVRDLALSPRGGPGGASIVLAGSYFGLFRSFDGGVTWTRSRDLRHGEVTTVATHPGQPGAVWAGSPYLPQRQVGIGIYRSVNGGATWIFSSRGFFETFASAMAFDPVTPGVLWAASQTRLWRSADHGAEWIQRGRMIPSLFAVLEVAIDPRDPRTIWAGTFRGVYVSEDGGATWEARRDGLTGIGAPFTAVDLLRLAPSAPSVAYAGNVTGLFRTADAGIHWTQLTLPLPRVLAVSLDALVDARDPDTVFLAWGDVSVSRDGGASWERIPVGSGSMSFHEVEADPRDPDVIYAGGEEGIFRTADGGRTWQRVTEIPVTYEGALAVGPAGEVWAASNGTDVYRSSDGLSGWAPVPNGGQFFIIREIEIDPHAPHGAFVVTNRGIFRHTEGD